ncbi:hypothetical protein HML84_03745 [Alcanivorax sp. IO_7]|nr:hypothetical protein HML84_03745 [Alcanivorax sp. IO_7]
MRLNADSEVIWGYHASTHHDLDITPDGDVVALTHEFTDEKVPAFAKLEYPWLDDYLVVLDGDTGEERSKVSLAKAFMESRYADLFYAVPSFATADPLHTNSVQFLDQDLADRFAPARGQAGQVLLSFRHPGAVALVDAASGEMTWALKGPGWASTTRASTTPATSRCSTTWATSRRTTAPGFWKWTRRTNASWPATPATPSIRSTAACAAPWRNCPTATG